MAAEFSTYLELSIAGRNADYFFRGGLYWNFFARDRRIGRQFVNRPKYPWFNESHNGRPRGDAFSRYGLTGFKGTFIRLPDFCQIAAGVEFRYSLCEAERAFSFCDFARQPERAAVGFDRDPLRLGLLRRKVGRAGDGKKLPGRRRGLGEPCEGAEPSEGQREGEHRLAHAIEAPA